MKILKFGGTSVGSADTIRRVSDIIKNQLAGGEKIVVVTSAMKGVTNDLVGAGRIAAMDDENYKKITDQIINLHINTIKDLIHIKSQSSVIAQLKFLTNNLEELLHGVYLLKELSLRSLDLGLSFGERLSSLIIAAFLNQIGIPSEWLDARQLIKTNDNFGNAKVLETITYENIARYFETHEKLQVVTGFIGSTLKGETTTLGRGGSDYTAALFGAALNVSEIQIWTDVDGVLTTDPKKVKEAFSQSMLTYIEAMEMSHFGAKVIYPPTLQPAFSKKIPLRIKNTFNPDFQGTVISELSEKKEFLIKGISSIENIALINLQGSGMVGVPGVASRLFSALASRNISIVLITQASSEHSICFAISPEDSIAAKTTIEEEFEKEIKAEKIDKVTVQSGLSVVAIIGENMKKTPGIAGKMFDALGKNGINVIAIAQGSSELNLSAVISYFDLTKALTVLHEAFFLSNVKTVNLYLAGTGLIGSTLLKQIQQQKEYLRKEHSLQFRLAGITNSRKMIHDRDGLNLETWNASLEQHGEASNIKHFVEMMQHMNLPNSVFVDCTASQQVVDTYENILNSSISISTPNKLASSGPLETYNLLYRLTRKKDVKFLYETNVGAGLPVITTLKDLKISGDWILKVEGVLSGTLSYIFNSFNGNRPFSEIVKEARDKGYTEPDPRNDLNGMDVVRKILILSREVGYEMEINEVKNEPLLPESCFNKSTVDEFFEELKNYDDHFESLRIKAEKEGKRLRFMATLEDGKAMVGLTSVDSGHPLYAMSGSDNMISFTTTRYKDRSLVIKGPGAGGEVTAAGVFAEIISIANSLP